MNTDDLPKTHLEAVRYFSDLEVCHEFLVSMRWPAGVECPKCGSKNVGKFSGRRKVCNCKNCKKQFTAKVGTIFEDSPLGLDLWFVAIWMILNAKNGISSCELGRALGIKQQSAWFVGHRIRYALERGTFVKMGGIVEVDESYIGGKARFMHAKDKKRRGITGTGMVGKTAVMGLLERHSRKGASRIIAEVLPGRANKRELLGRVRKYVLQDSQVHTDALNHYKDLCKEYDHCVIDHAEAYVDGHIHTNGLENFWSLLKRGLKGTYTFCLPFHLHRYLGEQVFRFNERKLDDGERFLLGVKSVSGKRLMYKTLIAKE